MSPVANGFETAREAGRYVELRLTRQILEQSGESATALCSGRGRGECAGRRTVVVPGSRRETRSPLCRSVVGQLPEGFGLDWRILFGV